VITEGGADFERAGVRHPVACESLVIGFVPKGVVKRRALSS
jgi:hypothetical protein